MALPKDLLQRLQKALDEEPMGTYKGPSKELKAKQQAKRDELKKGGKRAAEKDWVANYNQPGGIARTTRLPEDVRISKVKLPKPVPCKCPQLVEEIVNPPRSTADPVPAPKPTAERSVPELYNLLLERWARYSFVLVNPKRGNASQALKNALEIANLLEERGETEQQILTFLEDQDSEDLVPDRREEGGENE